VNVKSEHTISWSIQPHKKSINFGVFKHPGQGGSLTPSMLSASTFEPPPTPDPETADHPKDVSGSRNASSTATEKLKSIGLKPISWFGKCEADKISQGTYNVAPNEGGMYALVFDNTFSKQLSKTATFVLMTYPTNTPPQVGHQVNRAQAASTVSLAGRPSPKLRPSLARESSDSLKQQIGIGKRSVSTPSGRSQQQSSEKTDSALSSFYTGILQKRRRKKHQGFARRFFSLDYTSSTLSYYRNRNSSALRGAIPLALAAIATNEESREISIDSGAEVWHLKANNQNEFESWHQALERASKTISDAASPRDTQKVHTKSHQASAVNVAEEREWALVETLVGRVAGSRDAVRRLAKDSDPKYLPHPPSNLGTASFTQQPSPTESGSEDYFRWDEKKPFWKRKPSTGATPNIFKRSVSGQLPLPSSDPSLQNGPSREARERLNRHIEHGMHDHCIALLRDLDAVVAEFSTLIAESKQRRLPMQLQMPQSATSRLSIDTNVSDEFFDAEDGNQSQLLTIHRDSEEDSALKGGDDSASIDSASSSDVEGPSAFSRGGLGIDGAPSLFPSRPKSLAPLPLEKINRRVKVPPPTAPAPSLIGIFRKNVGKDLSSFPMPVASNEPISMLQRVAEQVEYPELLDKAAATSDASERLLYVAAFAVSSLSSVRVKDRSVRKPFNPMLGETFEYVREDKGFRFVSEKVSHHPLQLAFQAEAKEWTFMQSPMPSQKFWGKSSEIVTEGKARLILHSTGECFSWSAATSFVRNIIAGEKYVEPMGSMIVMNENTCHKAVINFKSKGMFSGRIEDVSVQAFDVHGEELHLGLAGTWTNSLHFTEHGSSTQRTVWSAGSLVDYAAKHYGFTLFAASLNEITDIEKGKLPATDSRLRPDQRAWELGDLHKAEDLKTELEERQRERRKETELQRDSWKPRWFISVDAGDEEVWKLKTGKDSYWEERARGEWTGVVDVFKL
jgi:oxysterol-binding protein-related protein 3/6/7